MQHRRSNMLRGLGTLSDWADELELYLENTEPLYRQKEAVRLNLVRHYCRGHFTPEKAAKGFAHVTDRAARDYQKEFGTKIPTLARRELDRELVTVWKRDVNDCLRGSCLGLNAEQRLLLTGRKCKISTPLAGRASRRRHRKRRS